VENEQRRFFDERAAAIYDRLPAEDPADAVAFLEPLARGGAALELGIGTGRVALPLAVRGVRVDGIDLSPAMVARLRARPGGDRIAVTMGDFGEVAVEGTFRLVYVVFNTFFNLGTQEAQVRCFRNVAARLDAEGSFVVEAYVPDPAWLRDGQYVRTESVEADAVRLDVCRIDAVAQRLDESHVLLAEGGVHLFPVVNRYAWPSEMDLMARLAGLRLRERWAGWRREPFVSSSPRHVSVYGR